MLKPRILYIRLAQQYGAELFSKKQNSKRESCITLHRHFNQIIPEKENHTQIKHDLTIMTINDIK